MDTAPRSGCPINAAVEVLGDPWATLVLRDVMFGDRRHFRELIAGSEEGIATDILASRLKLVSPGLLSRADRVCCSVPSSMMVRVPCHMAIASSARHDLVEVDPAVLEALAGGMGVGGGRQAQFSGHSRQVRARGGGPAAAGEAPAPPVGEDKAVGIIGVAGDAEQALVMKAMVVGTQRHQFGRVGGPSVLPVGDVMDLQLVAVLTARQPTGRVAFFDHHAGALGHDAKGPAHADRFAP